MGLLKFLGVKDKKEERKDWMIQNGKDFVEQIKKNKSLPIIGTSLFLNNGEQAVLTERVNYLTLRSIRKSVGGGMGARVGRIGIGGYSGQSESHKEWRLIDNGALTLTSQRLVFVGANENQSIPINKIISLECAPSEIHISMEGKGNEVAFVVSNPLVWSIAVGIIRKTKDPFALQENEVNVQFGD
jgi:hypothetical protein